MGSPSLVKSARDLRDLSTDRIRCAAEATGPLRTHCEMCGLAVWLPPRLAARLQDLRCERCHHHASPERLWLIRELAQARFEPELPLAS